MRSLKRSDDVKSSNEKKKKRESVKNWSAVTWSNKEPFVKRKKIDFVKNVGVKPSVLALRSGLLSVRS